MNNILDKYLDKNAALVEASKNGDFEAVKALLEAGADVLADDDSALRWASLNGHVEVVKTLLEAGANVHAGDDYSLQWASRNGRAEVVKILLEAGANVHAMNDHSLRWASANGRAEVVKSLLEAGANVHAENDCALRWASANGHVEVVELLEQYLQNQTSSKENLSQLYFKIIGTKILRETEKSHDSYKWEIILWDETQLKNPLAKAKYSLTSHKFYNSIKDAFEDAHKVASQINAVPLPKK